MTVVTDNTKNVLNVVHLLDNITEKNDLTCAAYISKTYCQQYPKI